jgi:hypothetical protein
MKTCLPPRRFSESLAHPYRDLSLTTDAKKLAKCGDLATSSCCWWRRFWLFRIWIGILQGTRESRVCEAPFVLSQLRAEEL